MYLINGCTSCPRVNAVRPNSSLPCQGEVARLCRDGGVDLSELRDPRAVEDAGPYKATPLQFGAPIVRYLPYHCPPCLKGGGLRSNRGDTSQTTHYTVGADIIRPPIHPRCPWATNGRPYRSVRRFIIMYPLAPYNWQQLVVMPYFGGNVLD